MHVYAVFLPPGPSAAPSAEKAELVRQGFNRSAFLFTPVWALLGGYWLAFALWLAWTFASILIAWFANLEIGAAVVLYSLGAFAFGLEADRCRQARLSQAGLLLNGLTLGGSLDEAESLYFGRRPDLCQPTQMRAEARPASAPKPAGNVDWPDATGGNDLLGLFPPQETKR